MLKTTLLRSLSILLLVVGIFLPSSCRRTLDYQLEAVVPQNYQPPAQGKITVNGPVELNARVFVIDSASVDQIVSFENNTLILKSTIRLRNARVAQTTSLASLQPGDYLVADVSPATPRGLFKAVTDKVELGAEVSITVKDATFEGLFKKVNFSIEGEVAPSISLERSFGSSEGVVTGSLAIKGEIKPSGTLKVELKVDDATVQHALASVTFKRSVSASMSASGAVTWKPNKPWELLRRSLPPIRTVLLVPTPFGIPLPIPIVITPDLVVKANLSIGVEGGFRATLLNLSDQATYGVSYDRNKGWDTIHEEEPVKNDPSYELKTAGFAELGLEPEFEFSFYDWDIVTVGINTELYGRIEAGCKTDLAKPDEANTLEVKLSAGLRATFFGRFDGVSDKLKGERKVVGNIPFGLVVNFLKSDYCNNTPPPIPNNTQSAAVAVSTGDPHLSTFDRTKYSFQAVGEFVAVRSTTPGDNFEIQVRQEPQPNSTQVSLNTGLAILTGSGSEVVCIYPNRVYLNGQNIGSTSGETSLAGGGKFIREANHLSVRTALGDQIDIRLFASTLDYDLILSTNRMGRIKGLFGNYDGASTNDLVRGDNGLPVQNTFASLYPTYAESWRIKQAASLFVYEFGKNTETYTDRSFPRTAVTLTDQQRASAESVCRAAGVTDPVALSNCIIDVAMTNNSTFANRALDFQLTTSALNAFSVGEFSTSDVQLEYSGASTENRAAVLDTRANGFARVTMRQGVNIRRGFSTEFNFSTAELNQSSCFYLALWPTDTKTRSGSQRRVGFCFGYMNGHYTAFYQLTAGSSSSTLAESHIDNFVDGRTHKVRIVESLLSNGQWQVEMFLDNLVTPAYSVINNESIADQINANSGVGYIEFQINQGSPSNVKLFNWQYKTL